MRKRAERLIFSPAVKKMMSNKLGGLRLRSFDHNTKKGLVVDESGFSLHAGVATKANERDRLEKICRYIARPAIAEERLSLNAQGDVVYTLRKPWDDGTTAIKMTQMQLMERLTALIPRPRVHLEDRRLKPILSQSVRYPMRFLDSISSFSV